MELTNNRLSIFVGALHGLITARALYQICNDLFGNVSSVTLDTDRYKYPNGLYKLIFIEMIIIIFFVNINFFIVLKFI